VLGLCKEIAEGKLRTVPFKRLNDEENPVSDDLYSKGSDDDICREAGRLESIANVDIDGDGKPDRIGLFQCADAPSCSEGTNQWLRNLYRDRDTIKKGVLDDKLRKLGTAYVAKSSGIVIYPYNGVNYIKTETQVFHVTAEKIETVCVFEQKSVTRPRVY